MKKYFLVGILVILFLFPLSVLIFRSISGVWRWPELFPSTFQFHAWKALLAEPRLFEGIMMTIWIGFTVVALNVLIGILGGKALAHYEFKGKSVIEMVLLAPILVPSLAIAIGLHITFIQLGLANHWLGVVFVHMVPTLPYALRIFRSGYDRLGTKILEQGMTLGVSNRKVFWSVELPLLLPSLRSAVMLTFIISLSQYAITAIIGGGNVVTLAMIYYPYFQSSNPAVIASFSVVFLLLPIMFMLVIECLIKLYKFVYEFK